MIVDNKHNQRIYICI